MNPVGIFIFLATYVAISARRVGALGIERPTAALLGACACVAFGVVTPDAALDAIDLGTLVLLFGVMGMGAFLVVDDFFGVLESRLDGLSTSPHWVLGATVWGSGILAAFVTNDAVCLLATPIVVRWVQRFDQPPTPFLLALATGANTGSAATLVGNPQNMLCGQLGNLGYGDYLWTAVPITLLALAANHAVLHKVYRKSLHAKAAVSPAPTVAFSRDHGMTLTIILGTAVVYTVGGSLAWTAAAGFALLLVIHRKRAHAVWAHIDGSLLLFFAGLFVVVKGLQQSGATNWLFAHFPLAGLASDHGMMGLAGLFLIGSNIVSNVPFILVVEEQIATLGDPTTAWTLLALVSTFAGNLTFLGSAANVIVAHESRAVGGFGFWEHFKVGAPVALISTAIAVGWMAL
ncbi:MAG: SLC13 family permease [bacterium]